MGWKVPPGMGMREMVHRLHTGPSVKEVGSRLLTEVGMKEIGHRILTWIKYSKETVEALLQQGRHCVMRHILGYWSLINTAVKWQVSISSGDWFLPCGFTTVSLQIQQDTLSCQDHTPVGECVTIDGPGFQAAEWSVILREARTWHHEMHEPLRP